MTTLDQRVAIITGASSGIGRATARALAAKGAWVALAARREQQLTSLGREIDAGGGRALVVPTDVTDRSQIDRLVDKTLAEWGRIDIAVANAGQYIRSAFVDVTVPELERSMAVNFYGQVHLVLAVLGHMTERRSGHIVLMATLDGKKGLRLDTPYVTAKSALLGLGDVARQELKDHGVNVSVILPARVDTAFVDQYRFPWISPKMKPEKVAAAVITALERNRAEVVVPHWNRLLILGQAASPRFTDWVIGLLKLEGWTKR